jgi:hypothetical protein
MFSKVFIKSFRSWDNEVKYGTDWHAADGNIMRLMRFACWVTKATITHSEYVILTAFPRQQWLRECSPMLRLYFHHLPCLGFVLCVPLLSIQAQTKNIGTIYSICGYLIYYILHVPAFMALSGIDDHKILSERNKCHSILEWKFDLGSNIFYYRCF